MNKFWFKPIDKIFSTFGDHVLDGNDPKKRRIFIDRGSDILFVAHLDTVLDPLFVKENKKRIYLAKYKED